MKRVFDIIEGRTETVASLNSDASIFEAATLMKDKNIGALLIMRGEKLEGIVSERDLARKAVLAGYSDIKQVPVKEIMTSRVICIEPKTTIEEAMALMISKGIRHLPVAEKNKVVGIISIRDLVKTVIENKNFVIEQLQNYIQSS